MLAGCSAPQAAVAPGESPSIPASGGSIPTGGAPHAQGNQTLSFPGSFAYANLTFDDHWDAASYCTLGCAPHAIDLAAQVPVGTPVQLSITSTANTGHSVWLGGSHLTITRYEGTQTSKLSVLAITLIRTAPGDLSLETQDYGPRDPDPAPLADGGSTIHLEVHILVTPSDIPAGIPIAVQLRGGDTLDARGPGVRMLSLVSPQGKVLRSKTGAITLAADAPAGRYTAVATANRSVVLRGPAQTLAARSYDYQAYEPHDYTAGQPLTFKQTVDTLPVVVGVILACKEQAGTSCVGGMMGSGTLDLKAPDGVSVLSMSQTCPAWCSITLAGAFSYYYSSQFLDEHLSPGDYEATLDLKLQNGMTAAMFSSTLAD